jgi:hypothetical protein
MHPSFHQSAMAAEKLLTSLSGALSPASKILADQGSPEFKTSLERWSNLDKETPYATIQPATEWDIVLVVWKAVDLSALFVPVAGGPGRPLARTESLST